MRYLYRIMAALVVVTVLAGASGCNRTGKKQTRVNLYPAYVVEDGNQRWGFIDDRGTFVIQPVYQWTGDFDATGLAVVEANDQYGVIDAKGKIAVTPAYGEIYSSPDGALIARNGDQYKVLNRDDAVWFNSDYPVTAFSDGLAPFSQTVDETTLWGYVKADGTVAIEPRYRRASAFIGGKAVVREAAKSFAIIDKTGASSMSLDCEWAGDLSEGVLAFRNDDGKYGYIALTGELIVPAQFDGAEPFRDGQAVVELHAPGDWPRYAIIDKQGKFVVAAQYSSLRPIGGGLYAAGESGVSDYYVPEEFTRKALVDRTGSHLTEFIYYDVGDLDEGLISVTDFTSTYFIDATGNRKTDLPRLDGIGEMKLAGNIVQARIDDDPIYVTRDGKVIWKPEDTQKLDGDITVTTLKYHPNRMILVRYPELYGPPGNGRDALNAQIKAEFIGDSPSESDAAVPDDYFETYTSGFEIKQSGNLMIIHRDSYSWPMGAAHGMPSSQYYHIDLASEKWYSLADLFKQDSGFTERLTTLVKAQMAAEPEAYWFPEADPTVRTDHPFTVTADGLVVYYYPYEIASYADGFPTFSIPWAEIQDIVDTEGAFWKAMSEIMR